MIQLSLSVFFLGLLVFANASTRFCAKFDSSLTGGAAGYFGIEIFNNTAYYSFELDLKKFSAPTCDLDMGLSYYIHSSWLNSGKSASGALCGVKYTGGHYDPNFACSPNSDSYSTCSMLNRTDSDFEYTCNKKMMNHKNYGFCEVGDLSGKHGMIYPTQGGSAMFIQEDLLVDYHPPYAAYYNSNVGRNKPWASIVFNCLGGTRLVCAKVDFDKGGNKSECVFPSIYSPTSAPTGLTPYWQNVVRNNDNTSICLIVIAVAIVFFIYLYIGLQYRTEAAKEAADKAAREKELENAPPSEIIAPKAVHH